MTDNTEVTNPLSQLGVVDNTDWKAVAEQRQNELTNCQEVSERRARLVNILRADWVVVSERIQQEAVDRDWCREYDNIVDEVNGTTTELKLIERLRDYEVSTSVTLTYSFNITVEARDEDEATDKVNDMDTDDIMREIKNGPGIDYTDDVEWTVDSVDPA